MDSTSTEPAVSIPASRLRALLKIIVEDTYVGGWEVEIDEQGKLADEDLREAARLIGFHAVVLWCDPDFRAGCVCGWRGEAGGRGQAGHDAAQGEYREHLAQAALA